MEMAVYSYTLHVNNSISKSGELNKAHTGTWQSKYSSFLGYHLSVNIHCTFGSAGYALQKSSLWARTKQDSAGSKSPSKYCQLDPAPTFIIKDCIDVLLPFMTKIINTSLISGHFPQSWKCFSIIPLLKKPNLERNLGNYRPVSNLKYISKLVESAAINQYSDYLSKNDHMPDNNAAYTKHHRYRDYTEHILTSRVIWTIKKSLFLRSSTFRPRLIQWTMVFWQNCLITNLIFLAMLVAGSTHICLKENKGFWYTV